MGGKRMLMVGALLAAAGIAAAADPEKECVVIVERAALYEEGHFNDQAYLIESLEYGTRVKPAPVRDAGETVWAKHWSVKLENGRRGVLEIGSFGWLWGVSEYNYVTIVDRAALYEKGHYGDGDHVMEWVEYRTEVQAGPVDVFGKGVAEFSLVKLRDGREGFMKTGSFGGILEIITEEAVAYDEPFGKPSFSIKKGEEIGLPELFIRGDAFVEWGLVQTKGGLTGWVKAEDTKYIPVKGKTKTLSEEGTDTSIQGVCR